MRKPIIAGNWKMNKTAKEAIAGSKIKLGAENVAWADNGAFTGEISADMLLDLGVKYVIIGHSERREYFAETDETVNKKIKAAIAKGLTPIFCCGESLEQREMGIMPEHIRMQIKIGMLGVTAEQAKNMVIAYEPIWAIGTGKTATADQADEVCGIIREVIGELYDASTAEAIRIQYGGSMKPSNAAELMSKPNIDGGLIGGAALKAEDFTGIVKY